MKQVSGIVLGEYSFKLFNSPVSDYNCAKIEAPDVL